MQVEIGPVPATSASAWLDYADGVLRDLDNDPRGMSAETIVAFRRYTTLWRSEASRGSVFRWQGEERPEDVEYLVLALYRLGVTLSAEEEQGSRPLRPADAHRFHVVLVQSLLGALAQQGESAAQFVAQLREVWAPATELD